MVLLKHPTWLLLNPSVNRQQQILFTWVQLHADVAQLIHYHKKTRACAAIVYVVVCVCVRGAFNFFLKLGKIGKKQTKIVLRTKYN